MSRIAWGATGERYFEAGVDRGVLYLATEAGVPWNGLRNVDEKAVGGDPKPYYIDGYKYLNLASAQEFRATISAFASPLLFARCDGIKSVQNGLFVTQQPRESFGLSYRTLVGNDISGSEHGHKIHLVYDALAAPAEKSNKSLGDSSDPVELSWDISTRPPLFAGFRPTAHLVIDSRFTPAPLLAQVEDILYGTDTTDAYLPQPNELETLFQSYVE